MTEAVVGKTASAEWPELQARLATARARWDAATLNLNGDEPVGEWSVLQAHSHVAESLLRYADVLACVAVSRKAVSREGRAEFPSQFLPGKHPYARVKQIGEKGWRDFQGAAMTVAKQPDRGAVIATAEIPIDARDFTERALTHLEEHVDQVGRAYALEQPASS
ncbi:MAG: hypothetical protein DK306_002033 [Chloroflexi bacterium]|jgi:hypothetical protein|nr:MAG: hypothetical protein DK306_002033 [Chloroflexota bacterium]